MFFELTKELFIKLAYWIIDTEPNYPIFGDCKLWIKKQNSQYIISKSDENVILILFTYLPKSQQMNNVLYAKYLDKILAQKWRGMIYSIKYIQSISCMEKSMN